MNSFSSLARWRTDVVVRVGPLRVRIISDVPNFPALAYFSRAVRSPAGPADVRLWCVTTTDRDIAVDRTARAKGFESGYYVTDHFGLPVRMSSRGKDFLLVGEHLENVVWPFFVKFLLLRHTTRAGSLFLKAAALEVGGSAALVVGRGGAGKTVFVSELCRRGAGFITNSHAIITDGAVLGVASSMRMRPGPWVDRLGVSTSAALDPDEVVVDPCDAFGMLPDVPVPLRKICVVDFRGPDQHEVSELSHAEALSVVEQFAFGLNVYRLEEDLLDSCDGDYREFAGLYEQMRSRLHAMVLGCRAYHVITNVQRPDNQDRMLELISGGV